MNKKTLELTYRAPDNSRWRFLGEGAGGLAGKWLMFRVKDGYRSYWSPEKLKLENNKNYGQT